MRDLVAIEPPSISETLRAVIIFFAVPAVWWLAVLFIRVPRGDRWRIALSYLRTPVGIMYLLVPITLVTAIPLWWIAGSVHGGGPAAFPFTTFWIGCYIAAAVFYGWKQARRK
jgi:hypothetical protein